MTFPATQAPAISSPLSVTTPVRASKLPVKEKGFFDTSAWPAAVPFEARWSLGTVSVPVVVLLC
jgi:hypothetical protein